MTLGPSLLLKRSTIAQYDTKRTVTTMVSQPKFVTPSSSADENKVRIQVPAAAAGGGGDSSPGSDQSSPTPTGIDRSSQIKLPLKLVSTPFQLRFGSKQNQPAGDHKEKSPRRASTSTVEDKRKSIKEPKTEEENISSDNNRKASPFREPRFV